MADKKEIAKDIGLTVITGPFGKLGKALTQALKKHKEAKTKKEKEKFQKMIDDLKSEIKLSKGDRGAAEDMPKKKAEENILWEKRKKRFEKIFELPQPFKPRERHPLEKTKLPLMKPMKKGGKIKTYAKGSVVRKPRSY